jgi:hypothetical protein
VSSPPFFHVVAGLGQLITINVTRQPGFTAAVNVTVVNPPTWLIYRPISILSSVRSGTLGIAAAKDAPKGKTELTLLATAPNSASQTTTLLMKVAGSYNFTRPGARGEVYDTTKTLDNQTIRTLVSYSNGTVTFSQPTPQLQTLDVGDVILLLPETSTVVPRGFSRKVLNVQNSGGQVQVFTQQASLLDEFVTLRLGVRTPTNSTGASSGTSTSSIAPQDGEPKTCPDDRSSGTFWLYGPNTVGPSNLQVAKEGSILVTAQLNWGICVHVAIGISVHWDSCFNNPWPFSGQTCPIPYPGLDDAELTLQGYGNGDFELNAKAHSVIDWSETDKLAGGTIWIPGVPIWFDFELDLQEVVKGNMGSHDVDMKASLHTGIIEGPAYQNGGWTWLDQHWWHPSCNFCSSQYLLNFETVSALQGSGLRGAIGPKLHVDVESGVVSADVTLHGFAELQFFNLPHKPVWGLYGGLEMSADVGGGWGLASASWPSGGGMTNLVEFPIFESANYPPTTPVLVIPNSAATVDLSNPGGIHGNTPISGWRATVSMEPEGESVTCVWMTKEVGQIGTSTATGNPLACPSPVEADFYKGYDQIVAMGLNRLTVFVVAEDHAGEKSDPSNAMSVKLVLPTPQLQILCAPCSPPPPIVQNQPFTVQGRATLATPVSSAYPNGINDLCQSEPLNIAWFVGGRFEADIVDVGEGAWTVAQSGGTGCNAPLVATSPGQTTIYLVLGTTDSQTGNWYIPEDVNSNPIPGRIVSVTVTVQAQTTPPPPPPPGVSKLVVTITSPFEGSSSPQHTRTSNPVVNLQGTVSGGAPPYTATWTATYAGHSYTISTFSSSGFHPIGLPFPNDRWDLASSSYCSTIAYTNGLVTISLSVTDSTHQPPVIAPKSGSANISCIQIQIISPLPGVALVTLLSVLFAVTAERKTILEKKPWLRALGRGVSLRLLLPRSTRLMMELI